jgi:uncharacterized protein YdaU (DUF1376 family)
MANDNEREDDMGNFIEDAEKRLEEERQRVKAQKAKEQAEADAKAKAEQARRDHEKRENSILF